MSIPITAKGGGHGYTCAGANTGGVLLDLRNFNDIVVGEDNIGPLMKIGAGLKWDEVLKVLDRLQLVAVHGQCTSVGVSGFSLHGIFKTFYTTQDNIIQC